MESFDTKIWSKRKKKTLTVLVNRGAEAGMKICDKNRKKTKNQQQPCELCKWDVLTRGTPSIE